MWWLIAALHGAFVVGVAFFTESKAKTVGAAVIGAAAAVFVGNPAYDVADLIAVGIGLCVGLVGIGTPKRRELIGAAPRTDLVGNSTTDRTSSWVPGMLAIGAMVGGYFWLGGSTAPSEKATLPAAAPAQVLAPGITHVLPPPAQRAMTAATPKTATRRPSHSNAPRTESADGNTREKTTTRIPQAGPAIAPPDVQGNAVDFRMPEVRLPVVVEPRFGKVDRGGHAGFDPSCRWVTPIRWACD